jgi:hypothetical protein
MKLLTDNGLISMDKDGENEGRGFGRERKLKWLKTHCSA